MARQIGSWRRFAGRIGALAFAAVGVPATLAWAGSTGSSKLLMVQSGGTPRASGDFVTAFNSTPNGLNTLYKYFIEVPSGLSRLRVQLFDADFGENTTGNEDDNGSAGRDRSRTGFSSAAKYTLTDPTGATKTVRYAIGDNAHPAGADNAWLTLWDSSAFVATAPAFGSVQSATSGSAGTLTITKPTGTASGDLLIAVIGTASNTSAATLTGWTAVAQSACPGGGGGVCHQSVLWKLAGGSEPASYTFTLSANAASSGAILRYTGVDQSNPVLDFGTPVNGNSGTAQAPDVEATRENTRVVRTMTQNNNRTSTWAASTSRINANQATITVNVADGTHGDGGAVGTENDTLGGGTAKWIAETLILKGVDTTATIPNGHWELDVDETSAVNGTGDSDINAIGIRADDGDATTGGTELNVYYDSLTEIGINIGETTDNKTYTFYPWVTTGCTFNDNDFDYDQNNGVGCGGTNGSNTEFGQIAVENRDNSFSATVNSPALSANNGWLQNGVTSFTSNTDALGYGIWKVSPQISRYNAAGTGTTCGTPDNGNYANLWFSNDQAATPTPTANPQTNAFRTYFSTDAINSGATTAPVKPYLETQIRYPANPAITCNGAANGPNPPGNGQTSCYVVTVRLVNPSGAGTGTITFSTPTNIVTSNIPGAGTNVTVTYEGNAQAGQGSIVSTPAAGASGNVTWNPGSVTAGTTTVMSYRIRVHPTGATWSGNVTATVASGNGTRATYVDHTGNSTAGSRSVVTIGPTCPLSLANNIVTDALVADLRAFAEGADTVVEWNTASEVGSAAFDLYRFEPATKSYVKVNEAPLAALVGAPQGGRYRFLDRSGPQAGFARYRVEEHLANGETRRHGPYRVLVEPDAAGRHQLASESAFEKVAKPRLRVQPVPAKARVAPALGGYLGSVGVAMGVKERGVYGISADDIASTTGVPLQIVRKNIAEHGFQLSNLGAQVSWVPGPNYDSVRFYGQPSASSFSAQNMYLLRWASGVAPAEIDAASPAAAAASFREDVHAEQQNFAATVVSTDPAADFWYWSSVVAGDPTYGVASAHVALPDAAASNGTAHLHVTLRGASTTGVPDEHHAIVSVNGSEVGSLTWSALDQVAGDFDFAQALLLPGDNVVQILGQLDGGVPYSYFYLDAIDVSYDRLFKASNGALEFAAGANAAVTVGGLPASHVSAWDVSDPTRLTVLDGTLSVARVGSVLSLAVTPGARYVVFADSAVRAPASVGPSIDSNLQAVAHGADEVIVVPGEFAPDVQALADWRRSQGLAVEVVTLEDIWSSFNYGMPSPLALQRFLAWTHSSWSPAPRYALLAGGGTFDYNDYQGYGGNWIPPLLVSTAHGLFASDAALGDVDGDGVPEIQVGRIPAVYGYELDWAVNKIIGYESAADDGWVKQALLLSDADAQTSFQSDLAAVAYGLATPYVRTSIDLTSEPVDTARSAELAAWNSGVGLVSYIGHGGMDRFSALGLLQTGDVSILHNSPRLPVVTAFTCVVNRFEVPGVTALGASLVRSAPGGAVAVYAPTGETDSALSRDFGAAFYRMFVNGDRLGDVIAGAQHAIAARDGAAGLLPLYNLLGDPATVLRRPAASPRQGGNAAQE